MTLHVAFVICVQASCATLQVSAPSVISQCRYGTLCDHRGMEMHGSGHEACGVIGHRPVCGLKPEPTASESVHVW